MNLLRPRLLPRAIPLLGFALLAACGDRDPGGSGRFEDGILVLEGSPRQMGWWHGRLLKDRIRDLHADLRRAAFEGAPGALGRAAQLEQACRQYSALVLPLLPERARQELDGLAEGSGIPAEDLLLVEVMRDGLRFHEGGARPLAGHLRARAGGRGAAWESEGPDAARLEPEWILVDRRPAGGTRSVVVAWPGSLGAVAGAGPRGVAALAAERILEIEREGLNGPPFPISLRAALEDARDGADLLARLSRTTGHEVVVLDPGAGTTTRAVLANIEPGPPVLQEADDPSPEGRITIEFSSETWTVRVGTRSLSVPRER
jgi:hypothetical protein